MNKLHVKVAAVAVMAMGMLSAQASAACVSLNLAHGAVLSVNEHCHHGHCKEVKVVKHRHALKKHEMKCRHDDRFRRQERHDHRDRNRRR